MRHMLSESPVAADESVGTRLDTAHQARTAAVTIVPHVYGLPGVSAGMHAAREGIVWTVPVVFHSPPERGFPRAEERVAAFHDAPQVGTLLLNADNAEPMFLTPLLTVRTKVERLLAEGIKASPSPLSLPVTDHEQAWRHAVRVFNECDMPPQLMPGKATKDDPLDEWWKLPVSLYDTNNGDIIWRGMVSMSVDSGYIKHLPDPALLKEKLRTAAPFSDDTRSPC